MKNRWGRITGYLFEVWLHKAEPLLDTALNVTTAFPDVTDN